MPGKQFGEHLDIAPEVAGALSKGRPVVALESTIISHGMPYPRNIETAAAVEAAVREAGAIPATIAILGGRLKVGLSRDEIQHIGKRGAGIIKCSRRDLPFVVAGIRVFATGGIGGVHRGVEDTMDVSADLEELGRTNVAVVCAGIKSVLDIGRTLEYLETQGVPVAGFQTDTLPAFYTRSSDFSVDYRVDSAADAAAAMKVKWGLGLDGGLVIAVPIPEEHALAADAIDGIIDEAIAAMRLEGIMGKDTTPYLLSRIAERTDGRSLEANIQLVINNARIAAAIAAEFAAD
jgi:pseudouridine-5'-phosphate glycosidase